MATSAAINFRNIFDPIPDSLTMQDVYEVPAGKVARIDFNLIQSMLDLLSTTSSNTYRVDQFLYIGNLQFQIGYLSGSIGENLSGRSFETDELKAGCSFWTMDGEFIEPREDDVFVKGASTSLTFVRSSVGVSDSQPAPRKISRSWTLSAGQKIQYGATKSTSLTMTTQRLIVDISGEVILEDV